MKNVKKILAIVLVLSSLVSFSVSVASFATIVTDGSKCNFIDYWIPPLSKSRWGNWLYIKDIDGSSKYLNKDMLSLYSRCAGFESIDDVQGIQARNKNGEIIEIKLDDDLKDYFSESQVVQGKFWGTWDKANLKKVMISKVD